MSPLEAGHNWRQTTVCMVARNFVEVDANPFYPRVDMAGEKTGITGMEFPLLNYLVYLVSELFGYQHWYGRLINLVVSSFGLWYFYRLIKTNFTEATAFYSTLVLGVSIWFEYARKIMPDTFSVSLVISAIYYACNYLDAKEAKDKYGQLLLSIVLLVAGVLSKLPAGSLLAALVPLYFNQTVLMRRKIFFAVSFVIGMIPVVAWYYYWVPYLVESYGYWHFFMGKPLTKGIAEIIGDPIGTLSRYYEIALQYSGFLLFCYGLWSAYKHKHLLLLRVLACVFLSFAVIMFKAGHTFIEHSYYIVPFVPIMALVAGYGLTTLPIPWLRNTVLLFVAIEGIANQQHDLFLNQEDAQLQYLETTLDKHCERADLVIINSGKVPTPMYFAHRKGWIATNTEISDTAYIAQLKQKGLKCIVILKKRFGSQLSNLPYEKLEETTNYSIYRP